MNTKRCPYGGRACEIDCILGEGVESQDKMGGQDPNDPAKAGPIWFRRPWKDYTDDVQQQAKTKGCLVPDEVRQRIQRVTRAKQRHGEFR